MRRAVAIATLVALTLLPGCANARQYRPGPRRAGLRAYIYEHTPINAAGPFIKRPARNPMMSP